MPSTVDYGRCPTCDTLMLPIVPLSPCGHDEAPVVAPLEEPGVVYSYTRQFPEPDRPRVIAMVDFLGGRLRVASPVLDLDEVAIGDHLRAVPGRSTPVAFVAAGD